MVTKIFFTVIFSIICISGYTMFLYDAIQAAINHNRKSSIINCAFSFVFVIIIVFVIISIPGVIGFISSM